jgi:hypothetical protein
MMILDDSSDALAQADERESRQCEGGGDSEIDDVHGRLPLAE